MKILILTFVFFSTCGYATNHSAAVGDNSNCKKCHTCDKPTTQDACLYACPRHKTTASNHSSSEGPDIVTFKEIADKFTPVKFNHRAHANMSMLGVEKCSFCHHYTPPTKIPPCRDCHTKNSSDLKQPGLKGAYHRQCLGCHREWSHENKCFSCHESAKKDAPLDPNDKSDIIANTHPKIHSPKTLVYKTPYKKAPIVTFHHDQHVNDFQQQCVSCHEKFTCSNCHDPDPKKKKKRSMLEVHQSCDKCHRADACTKCHSSKEKAPFDHAVNGWKLNYPHRKLACNVCHSQPNDKPPKDCKVCHPTDWKTTKFDHAVTGFKIDATHINFECNNCHTESGNYNVSCIQCHSDGRDYRKKPAGLFLTP